MNPRRPVAALAIAIASGGCGHVRATERERLASPAMQFEMDPAADQQRDSILEITEGGTFSSAGPGTAGAGCGCKLIRAFAIACAGLVVGVAPARAQIAGDPPPAAPSTTPAPPAGTDEPRPEDYRDPIDDPQPPGASEPEVTQSADDGDPVIGTARVGVYTDSDQTTVWRALGTLSKTWGHWTLNGGLTVDSVTSASVDVRSSPALGAVDVVTSASGQSSTSGGQMTDTRYQGTAGAGWKDTDGHAANATAAVAAERDYASVSGGLNGSYDILDRTATLLGGVTITDNWVSSVLDSSLHRKMLSIGWSAGIARVLTPRDALRLRYDGTLEDGYQASPYRNVRFGDWTTTTNALGQIMFANTIGPAGGLPETLPQIRVGHALVLEWVHSLGDGIGLHPMVRVSDDTWGVASVTPSLELRIARPGWRMQLGYRFYLQSQASFFASKYQGDPSMYTYYTSDKELGRQIGHLVDCEYSTLLSDDGPNDRKLWLYLRADVFRYSYPGFVLLDSRTSAFLESGLSWEL